jgi:transposase
MTLQAKHGIEVSAETVHRWLHEIGWVWKRATLVAKDDDPTTRNGSNAWPGFGFSTNTCGRMR